MSSRSQVSLGVILKHFMRLARHPWIGTKLAKLQGEKWLFHYLYPRPDSGYARRIRQASFRITDLCNLRCHTCGQWGDRGFLHGQDLKKLKQQEVPPSRYLDIFTDLVRHGHRPLVYFWGGEPMLYEGIVDLIEEVTALGLPVAIATNGSRLAAAAPRLAQAPMFLLQISIDGHDAALHNRLRPAAGKGNNFRDIQQGLQAVRQAREALGRDLPMIASLTTISQENLPHLVDIYQTFRHQVDLFVFYLSWWIDPENARAHDQDFQRRFGFTPTRHWGWVGQWKSADYHQLHRQLETLKTLSRPWSAPPVTVIPPIFGLDNLRTYYTHHQARFGYDQCISIFQVVEVNSNGDVSPCRDYHDYVVGNIKESTLTELWNSPAYRRFRHSLATAGLMPVCTRCCGLMGY